MVTQTVSDRAGIGTQVIWDPRAYILSGLPPMASLFLFGLSFSSDLWNPSNVLCSKGTEGSKTDMESSLSASKSSEERSKEE